jgi:hypothetical protein
MQPSEPRRDSEGSAGPDEEESKMAAKKITPVAPAAKSAATPDKAAARVSKKVVKKVVKRLDRKLIK